MLLSVLRLPFRTPVFYLITLVGLVTGLGLDYALWQAFYWGNVVITVLVSLFIAYVLILALLALQVSRDHKYRFPFRRP
jgi:predicted exporter